MTIYTQADADAAKAKLALDTQALTDDQQAALAAQAGATSAAQAVTDAQAQADAADAAVVAAQQNAAVAQAALSSANGAVTAVQADMAAQQAIIDAFAAQPIPAQPKPPASYVVPDLPVAPNGPFTSHGAMKVAASNAPGGKLSLAQKHFSGNYIAIELPSTFALQELDLSDILCDPTASGTELGSLFYMDSGGSLGTAMLRRIAATNLRPGRPLFRFCGKIGLIDGDDISAYWDSAPNTHTGDIATLIQVGNKAAGEHIGHVKLGRVAGGNIFDNQPSSHYWNGDIVTTERGLDLLEVAHLTARDVPDGGIDSKARRNVFGTVLVERAREGLKLWDDSTTDHLTVLNSKLFGGIGGASGVRLMGKAPDDVTKAATRVPVHVCPDVYFAGDLPPIHIENGPVEIHYTGRNDIVGKMVALVNGGAVHPNSTFNGSAFPK